MKLLPSQRWGRNWRLNVHYFPSAVGAAVSGLCRCVLATLSGHQGRQAVSGTVLLAARIPCSSSFLFTSPFLVLGMQRNALLWSFALGCVDSPQMAIVRSGQTVRNSFKGKDSHRRPSPWPALWGSPARREQNPQGTLLSCPGTPHRATGWSGKASQLPSFRHLWMTRF